MIQKTSFLVLPVLPFLKLVKMVTLSTFNWNVCVCVQLWLTLCKPMDYSPPGSSVHGILQVRILEWVAISSSRESSQPRDQTRISCVSGIEGGFFTSEPDRKILSIRAIQCNILVMHVNLLYKISVKLSAKSQTVNIWFHGSYRLFWNYSSGNYTQYPVLT